jgi:hypothetical protein
MASSLRTLGLVSRLNDICICIFCSDVGSYLKLGGQLVLWGHNLPPLVEIGLTDLLKAWWAIAHPAHPSSTSQNFFSILYSVFEDRTFIYQS